MIAITLCDRNDDERNMIAEDCKKRVAISGNESMWLEEIPNDLALRDAVQAEKMMDLLYYEFQQGQPLDTLRRFRREYGDSMIMLITDPGVSPLEYLRPGVAPDGLLLRPVEQEHLDMVNREFFGDYYQRIRQDAADTSFVVDTREEKVVIPYSHIYCFESREKKLFVRTRHREVSFYDTMDALETRLPDTFLRCHRSYIVNLEKILRYIPAERYLELADRIGVPVSRSYISSVRKALT